MTSRQLRIVRAAAGSSTATILAAASHTIGGGAPPHPLLILALSVLLLPIVAVLIGRRLSVARTAVAVLVAQAAFHLVFHTLGGVLGPVAGHSHHTVVLAPAVSVALPDAPMLLAHTVAALLTIVLLWRGERALRGIATWVRARLLQVVVTPATQHRVPQAPEWMPQARSLSPLAASVTRRGPPQG